MQKVLPPGTILQLMHLEGRLKKIKPGIFLEIGAGHGHISELLLNLGWRGVILERSEIAIKLLNEKFKMHIANKKLTILHQDFLKFESSQCEYNVFDLVISSMVLEHLDDNDEMLFLSKCKNLLHEKGVLIGLVPAEMRFWGIEDTIAGHYRRYDRQYLKNIFQKNKINLLCMHGLTFPVSNLLLPISNFLVKRAEINKLSLSKDEQTIQSGVRDVSFKTKFPIFLKLILNNKILLPLYILQILFKNSNRCMVLYFEGTLEKSI